MTHFANDIDWPPTLALLTIAALLLVAAGALIVRGIQRRTAQPPVAALAAQRTALVEECVKVRALLDDPQLSAMLDSALRDAGVSVFDPVGQRKDPARHRIDHSVAAPDAASAGIVAGTLTPGYLDGDRLLAPAEVVVYKWQRP